MAYPGAGKRLPWSWKTPTLELPWSWKTPTLELPWSSKNAYPGATLELGKRPHWSGSRVGPPPLDLAGFPCDSSSSSRSSPKAPGSPNNPPPPAYPGAPLGPSPGPLRGLRTDGRPGPPDLGSWSSSYFPQKQFVWEICQIDSRPRAGGEGTRQRGDRLPWSAYPGAPTLEPETDLPYTSSRREGRRNNQPKPNTPENPYASPRGCSPREKPALGKSRRSTAYPQQIVTTRLLYCLQDRFAQLSRLQRI